MGDLFNSMKKALDEGYEMAIQNDMIDKSRTIEDVIKYYPIILTSKEDAKELILESVKYGYICRVSYYNRFDYTCRLRDSRTTRIKEYTDLKEIIVLSTIIYVITRTSDGVIKWKEVGIRTEGSNFWFV